MKKYKLLPISMFILLALVACGGEAAVEPQATLVQVTPLATDTAVPPTTVPEPTAAPPTATALPPTEAPPTVTPTPTLAERMDAFMIEETEAGRFSGAVLVAQGDEVLLKQGYGLANRAEEVPNTSATRFRIGLLTRGFTAMAVLQLQEQGLLSVGDPICNYISDCPETWQPITIHHLLSHSSGILDQASIAAGANTSPQPLTPNDIVDLVRVHGRSFEPGTRWRNSNVDYLLLGMIIEQVSGKSYEQYLKENIFDPLGMTDTGYINDSDDLAQGYLDRFRQPGRFDEGTSFAFTGLYSTVEDLHRWAQALQTGQHFSEEALMLTFTPYVSRERDLGPGGAYGYGWSYHMLHGRPAWGCCERGFEGFTYDLQMFIEDGVTAIILSNQQDHRAGLLSDTMTKWLLEGE